MLKKLSILVPAHNEERFIEKVLEELLLLELPCLKEIVVVNDGSTDDTKNLLKRFESIKLIEHSKNKGKGAAIKTGVSASTGDWLIIQDADMEYAPKDIPILLASITPGAHAIYGNRGSSKWPRFGFHYVLGAKIITILINILYQSNLKDTYTGYKLFNMEKMQDTLQNIESNGFDFEAEVTCKILKQRGSILEKPISYKPRNKNEGKHIGFRDAISGALCVLKNRFLA